MLPSALMAVVHWLLQCLLHVFDAIPSSAADSTGLTHPEMYDLPVNILHNMVNDDFMLAILHLAKYEDQGKFSPEVVLDFSLMLHLSYGYYSYFYCRSLHGGVQKMPGTPCIVVTKSTLHTRC